MKNVVGRAVLLGAVAAGVLAPAAESAERGRWHGGQQSCFSAPMEGKGVVSARATAPSDSVVRVSIDAGEADWDVAVLDAATGDVVAAGAGFTGTEFASNNVAAGQELVIQACRISGKGPAPELMYSFYALPDVTTPPTAANALRLRRAQDQEDRQAAQGKARAQAEGEADRSTKQGAGSDLPSGRTEYRYLWDYEWEMKQLVARYPWLVKPLVLNHETWEERKVNGIEITYNARKTNDGKPIHLELGVHHAREWPASEHVMELAYDLVRNRNGAATSAILSKVRTLFVPIVNPDGFNVSRNADPGDPADEFGFFDYEMKRKNCRPVEWAPDAPCQAIPLDPDGNAWGAYTGVDLNRNYHGLWGGPGASVNPLDNTYRGPGPSSEPETQNVVELHQRRNVATLITNHTWTGLVLRPPGQWDIGTPIDDPIMEDIGARMASHNGYVNGPSYGLYQTTGSTEDVTYWSYGSLGYTFEIGDIGFHPPFEQGVIGEYLGREPALGAGLGGNRAAYYEILGATTDLSTHSLITGRAPKGAELTLSKEFQTSSWDPLALDDLGNEVGDPILTDDGQWLSLKTKGGKFAWHVTPSTRPIVAGRIGREATGPPQAGFDLVNPPGIPELNTGDAVEGPNEIIPFTVQGPDAGVDNGRVTVRIQWTDPAVDWDFYIIDAEGNTVGQSAEFGDNDEDAVILDPPPGEYRAVVVNFDQAANNENPAAWDDWTGSVAFQGPMPTVEGTTEAWTLTCTTRDGDSNSQDVVVDRGESVRVEEVCG